MVWKVRCPECRGRGIYNVQRPEKNEKPQVQKFFLLTGGSVSGVKSRNEVLVLLRGRLDAIEEDGVASAALEEEPAVPTKGGIAGLKVVFFLPLLPWPDMMEVMWLTSFSVKEVVKPEKRGFQPMRKKLGEKFGLIFSLTVVVTDTELFLSHFAFHDFDKEGCEPYVH